MKPSFSIEFKDVGETSMEEHHQEAKPVPAPKKQEEGTVTDRKLSKLLIGCIFLALLLQIVAISIFRVCLFKCGPNKLKPTCQFGFCTVADTYTFDQIEDSIPDLQEAKVEALIVDFDAYQNEKGQNLIRKLNRHGIVMLFRLPYTKTLKSFEILNNGYIITGADFVSIKNYDWSRIKQMKKSLDDKSHVRTCLYIEIKDFSGLQTANTEKFAKRMDLCGFVYSESIVTSSITDYTETDISAGDILLIDAKTKHEVHLMPYMPLNCSVSIQFPSLDLFVELATVFVRSYAMRTKLLPLSKRVNFVKKTISSDHVYVKSMIDIRTKDKFEVVIIPAGSKVFKASDIETGRKSWRYLLPPKPLERSEIDAIRTEEEIPREGERDMLVVVLYK